MEKRFYVERLRKGVALPTKAYEHAAGFDFYIPTDFEVLPHIKDRLTEKPYNWESKTVLPGTALFIPSGLRIKMHSDWWLKFENKSGISIGGLVVGASVIDPDYQGEFHYQLWNASNQPVTVKAGQKIVQGMFYQIPNIQIHEKINQEELFAAPSARGTKGFGSTQQSN